MIKAVVTQGLHQPLRVASLPDPEPGPGEVLVDVAEDVAAYDAWLEEWGSRLTRMSEEMGCGCCDSKPLS